MNTCPRWASQTLHTTSVRAIPALWSASVVTLFSVAGAKKLGQPVPESNLASEPNRSLPQQTQRYVPSSLQLLYFPLNGGSVPFCLHT